MEKYWRSSDAAHRQLQGLIQVWSSDGTYDQLNLGVVTATKELARQIQSHVNAYSDLDHVSWCDSRFDTGSRRAGDTLAAFVRWHTDRRIEVILETQPAHPSFGGQVVWYDGGTGHVVVAPGSKVQPPGAGKAGRGRAGGVRFRGEEDGMKAGGGRFPATAQ